MKLQNEFGYCSYEFEEDYVNIFSLYIYPEYRRQGHATQLLKTAIKEIREQGWDDEIQIVALPSEDSISKEQLSDFYESLGLKVFDYYG